MPGTFPRHRLQRKLLVSDTGRHHGTCLTHVPWCMSGSIPNIPGACTTSNFMYLARGPLPEGNTHKKWIPLHCYVNCKVKTLPDSFQAHGHWVREYIYSVEPIYKILIYLQILTKPMAQCKTVVSNALAIEILQSWTEPSKYTLRGYNLVEFKVLIAALYAKLYHIRSCYTRFRCISTNPSWCLRLVIWCLSTRFEKYRTEQLMSAVNFVVWLYELRYLQNTRTCQHLITYNILAKHYLKWLSQLLNEIGLLRNRHVYLGKLVQLSFFKYTR